jgi:hypothetical protein
MIKTDLAAASRIRLASMRSVTKYHERIVENAAPKVGLRAARVLWKELVARYVMLGTTLTAVCLLIVAALAHEVWAKYAALALVPLYVIFPIVILRFRSAYRRAAISHLGLGKNYGGVIPLQGDAFERWYAEYVKSTIANENDTI